MEKLNQIIDGGESITVEFKQSKGKLNFSICKARRFKNGFD